VALPALAVLVMTKSATGLTVKVAVTKVELAPTDVDNEPAGIVLMTCGELAEVTTTDKEQLALGAITVPTAKVTVPNPAIAEGAGPTQVVATPVGDAFTNPAG
jgi:hypothetical protein